MAKKSKKRFYSMRATRHVRAAHAAKGTNKKNAHRMIAAGYHALARGSSAKSYGGRKARAKKKGRYFGRNAP